MKQAHQSAVILFSLLFASFVALGCATDRSTYPQMPVKAWGDTPRRAAEAAARIELRREENRSELSVAQGQTVNIILFGLRQYDTVVVIDALCESAPELSEHDAIDSMYSAFYSGDTGPAIKFDNDQTLMSGFLSPGLRPAPFANQKPEPARMLLLHPTGFNRSTFKSHERLQSISPSPTAASKSNWFLIEVPFEIADPDFSAAKAVSIAGAPKNDERHRYVLSAQAAETQTPE